jgi:hypothetical protein
VEEQPGVLKPHAACLMALETLYAQVKFYKVLQTPFIGIPMYGKRPVADWEVIQASLIHLQNDTN